MSEENLRKHLYNLKCCPGSQSTADLGSNQVAQGGLLHSGLRKAIHSAECEQVFIIWYDTVILNLGVLDFWSLLCSQCPFLLPDLAVVSNTLGGEGGVHTDELTAVIRMGLWGIRLAQ